MAETRRVAPNVQQYISGSTYSERRASIERAMSAAEGRNDVALLRQLRRALSDEVWRDANLAEPGRQTTESNPPSEMFKAPPSAQRESTAQSNMFKVQQRRAVGRAVSKRNKVRAKGND